MAKQDRKLERLKTEPVGQRDDELSIRPRRHQCPELFLCRAFNDHTPGPATVYYEVLHLPRQSTATLVRQVELNRLGRNSTVTVVQARLYDPSMNNVTATETRGPD